MNSRILIFLIFLVSPGIASYNHLCSYLIPLWEKGNNYLSRPVTGEHTIQSFNPERVIQVGAFRLEPNALTLKGKLTALINKPVFIVQKDGYFKVQVTGFTTQKEVEMLLRTLGLFGIKNIWVVPEKKLKEVKPQFVIQANTAHKVTRVTLASPVDVELKPFKAPQIFALQIGVFHNRSEALRAQKRVTTRFGLPVKIVQEWEYYKVIITGFLSMEDTFIYYPKLANMGYPNIIMIEAY